VSIPIWDLNHVCSRVAHDCARMTRQCCSSGHLTINFQIAISSNLLRRRWDGYAKAGMPLTLTTVLDPINVRNSVIRTISLLGRLRTFVFDLVPVLNVCYIINAPLTLVQHELRWGNNRLVEKIWKFSEFIQFSRANVLNT